MGSVRVAVMVCALVFALSAMAVLLAGCGSDSDGPSGPILDATAEATDATVDASPSLRLVGQHDLGGVGGADVWANGDVAYVGARCDSGGVKIVDVSDASDPRLVSRAADHDNTSAEDVMVIDARTRSFEGELMAVGLQDCPESGEPGMQGLDLWDVSDPAEPEQLGFLEVGPLPFGGVHELYVFQREERVFGLLAVPFSEVFHPDGLGDLRIVELTDPRNPVELADWGAGKDGELAYGASSLEELAEEIPALEDFPARTDCAPPAGADALCRGDMPHVLGHSASANEAGTRAYVAYWDAGMVILDISEPSRPELVGRAEEPASEEGNLHSAIVAPGDELAITTDEDFVHEDEGLHGGPAGGDELPIETPHPGGEPRPGDRWGFARIWDISIAAQPRPIGRFETPDSAGSRTDGLFTVHNPEVHGDLLFLSWYSEGVRVLDISEPKSPREVASWVPEPMEGFGDEPIPPLVWGVHVEGDLVFLSDMAAGLYVLEMSGGE